LNRYSCIGAYITHLSLDQKGRIVFLSAKQLPDDGFVTKDDSIWHRFILELQCDPFLHLSINDCSDIGADSNHVFVDPVQPPVRTWINGTTDLAHRLSGKPISNKYFDIFDDDRYP